MCRWPQSLETRLTPADAPLLRLLLVDQLGVHHLLLVAVVVEVPAGCN